MAGLIIQFHITIEELEAFLLDVVADAPVYVTALRFFPFSATPVDKNALSVAMRDPIIRELALTLDPPTLREGTQLDFHDDNPSALLLDIGRLSEQGLKESCLSVKTADERSLKVWRRIARRLRKITQTGAVATNPDTGATGRVANHRFTAGAKALDDKGVIMRPFAGGSVLHFGERK